MMPEGWKFGTSLPVEDQVGQSRSAFKPISLDMLVDSPVITGEYYRAIDITPAGEPIHHELDMAADSEAALNMSADNQKEMVNLVAESGKLFGTRHYRDYHFLLALSDHVAHFGLEHHESNDSRLPERALLMPSSGMSLGGLLAHEFVHSWNGKFRRPADLTTPYYEEPMETDLLWGYEGLTDYLGPMLAARSGLWTRGAVSRVPGQHCGGAWTGAARAHVAAAARYGERRAWHGRRPGRMAQLEARHRLLRRRRPGVA